MKTTRDSTAGDQEKPLATEEIQVYRRRLLSLAQRLGEDLSELEEETLRATGGEAGGNLSDVPVHPADLGTENYEEEFSLALLENEAQLLQEIDDAVDRIEAGTFGRCENCGRQISRARLNSLPYARYCVRCARQLQGDIPKLP